MVHGHRARRDHEYDRDGADVSDPYAQAIIEVKGSVPVIRTGTVTSDLADSISTYVVLDNDPTATPVRALSAAGVFEQTTRVAMLAYPPRGLIIIGRLDGDAAFERLRLTATDDVSLTSTLHALQIGPTTGANLAMDNNEIQARSNGAAAGLFLNNDGGLVGIGTGAATGNVQIGPTATAHVNMNFNQIWALNGAAASDLFLNFSSAGDVQIGDGTAGGAQIKAAAMAPTVFTTSGPGGSIISTSYVSSAALGSTFTMPSSGRCMIHFAARATITATTNQRGLWTFQIQQTNSAGAVIRVANTSDFESCEGPVGTSGVANLGIYSAGRSIYVTGTPGNTIFISLCARVTAATATIQLSNAYIALQPLP